MDIFLLIYIVGVVIIPIASLILNYKYKWIIKKDSFEGVIESIYEILLSALLWPIILLFALLVGIIYLVYQKCIPNK